MATFLNREIPYQKYAKLDELCNIYLSWDVYSEYFELGCAREVNIAASTARAALKIHVESAGSAKMNSSDKFRALTGSIALTC